MPNQLEKKGGEAALQVTPQTLFRPQALEAQQEQALGTVLLVQPLSSKLLTLVAAGIAACLIMLASWGEYTRKAHVKGFLAPTQGLIKVYPRETGAIIERLVNEGQRVKRGDKLFVVAMPRPSGEAIEARASALARMQERRASLEGEVRRQEDLARLETQAAQQRISATEREQAQLEQEIATQLRRVASAESSLARYRALRAERLISEEQLQDKLKDHLQEQAKQQALERNKTVLLREIETQRANIASANLQARTQRATLERSISTLAQEQSEYAPRRSYVVTAPEDGVATALLADRGHTAMPGQPLVSILPANTLLEAHLLVPSSAVGFLAPGQTVLVRHEAFPYQRFGTYQGQVAEISRTLLLPGETTLPVQLQEPAYRVTVRLDTQTVKAYGQDYPLKAGMLLDADVWLERRKLYEWLLDPLYSVVGRV